MSDRQMNRIIAELERKQIRQVLAVDRGRWRHPWFTSLRYDFKREEWLAMVKPGFVNGLDATLQTPWELATGMIKERYLREGLPEPSRPDELIDAYLTESPSMRLTNWRAIGPDGPPQGSGIGFDGTVTVSYESVPDYFRVLGVGPPPTVTEGVNGLVTTPAPANSRLLRATELMLYKDRTASNSSIIVDDGLDGTIVNVQSTRLEALNKRDHAYLRTLARYNLPVAADPLQRLMGIWTDTPRDELHIATIYLMSPPGAAYDSVPDGTWAPYLQHRVFWNLGHGLNIMIEAPEPEPLRLVTGLAGGMGDALINFLLTQINDAFSALAQFLRGTQTEGRFWTE